ncbi:MAG TPA: hypothetical protein VG899_12370 [Mycobacteriales bacterium]|nr:hypothetical protein [Mycobacteriales bacterium]
MERKCGECHQLYIAQRSNSRYCSPKCRVRASRSAAKTGASSTRKLRVVADVDDDTAAKDDKQKARSVLEAVETGDYLSELVATRRRIAVAVSDPNTPARDLAALTRRQLEISKEIRAIEKDRKDEVGEAADTPDEAWPASRG